jgi:molybdopterin synthase catalytic subunit
MNLPDVAVQHHLMRADSGVCHAAVVSRVIDVGELIARVEHHGVGALSIFLGTVRDQNAGRTVTGMDYEAYEPMAGLELTRLTQEIASEVVGLRVAVEHRVGSLALGEVSVAIVAAHARRAQAIAAAARLIEVIKVRVPIWKREHYVDGERRWVDPTS